MRGGPHACTLSLTVLELRAAVAGLLSCGRVNTYAFFANYNALLTILCLK